MRSTASLVPLRLYSFVLIGLLALLAESCRTTKTTQTEQARQTAQASESQDSNTSLSQQVESLKVVTVAGERWTEQAWTITPLPDGSLQVKGKSHERRRADSTVQARAEQRVSMEAAVKRRQEQEDESAVRTVEKQRSNEVLNILLIWLTGIVLLTAIGYILVKRQNKTRK